MNVWLESLGLLFVTLFLAIAGIWAFQRWGIYSFDPAVTTPAESGLPGARAVRFVSEDGTTVTAWLVDPVGARPVIISFQGNGCPNSGVGPSPSAFGGTRLWFGHDAIPRDGGWRGPSERAQLRDGRPRA